jgi:hypothetical protein
MDEIKHTTPPQEKKAYHSPLLEDYGPVQLVTKTTSGGAFFDGGSYPLFYSSSI